jgi:hypothetical protein
MYSVDDLDRVVPITDLPKSSVGAPMPLVVANEHSVVLAYLLQDADPTWDGTSVRVLNHESAEPAAMVRFQMAYAHYFGMPNDEAFEGHPLHARGLEPYSVARIENSSWIRQLAEMNSVHEHHSASAFAHLQHFIFAFHDSVFECVARSFELRRIEGPLSGALEPMYRWL